MLASAGVWKRKREDLKSRRTPLLEKYKKDPNNLLLAGQIKLIDDQMAECTEHITQERRSSSAISAANPKLDLSGTELSQLSSSVA
jgi:hypothetical protein